MSGARFDRLAVPQPRSYYARELGELRRPSRGWAAPKSGCPFHESKSKTSFHINLNTGGFHCFGCGAHGGDIIAFVRRRDNCDFPTACKKLGAWRDMSLADRRKITEQTKRRDEERVRKARAEAESRRRRIALRDQLHAAVRDYQETSDRLDELSRGAASDWDKEEESCWSHLRNTLDHVRQLESTYNAAAGLEFGE